ncbi:LysR family transcriptional regulator [Pseudomonas sp.]|uniref:LysR family transcriptional regulator n=1 Tax=Pseudomonas sp. TaxID=306 RepID=UPI002632037B|nr:LysR family transcriptional regulator [Pseudomonas sp.]
MVNVKQIEAFYWTVKLGTLQRAATHLFITQSAVTKRLQELEKNACQPLFEDNGPKTRLTAKGEELLITCEALIAGLAELQTLRGKNRQVARNVKMGVTELVTLTWFSSFVAGLKAAHPDVSLHPDVDLSARLQQKLLDGDLDLVVIPEDYVTSAMTSIHLQSIEFAWLAPPHQFAESKTLSLKELATWPLIVQGPDSGITQRCEQLFVRAGIDFNRVYGSNSLFALVALIRAGVGLSCVPRALFAKDIEQQVLQEVSVQTPPPPVNYHLAILKHGHSGLTGQLAELCRLAVENT